MTDAQRLVRLADGTLARLFGAAYARDFAIRFWNGATTAAREGARFVLCVNAPYALRAAFAPPLDLNPGRAFVNGWLDVEGDLEAAVDAIMRATSGLTFARAASFVPTLLRLPPPPHGRDGFRRRGHAHQPESDARAIAYHYDRSLAFFRAFLDPTLVYSCAYWDDGIATLEDAQTAKIDYVLNKLRLRPGERLLDVGCGWGTLAMRAASHFGAEVTGITISAAQRDEALRRIAAAGLADRVRVDLLDYRALGTRTFDKIASVGMVEHVGEERLEAFFDATFRALRPGGLFLCHGIAEQAPGRSVGKASGFIARYVFPDGDLVPIGRLLERAQAAGFEIRDVENLREHYARTIRVWLRDLEAHRDAAVEASDETAYRVWRLYLAGSAQGFACGRLGVFQSLLARRRGDGAADLPPTRRDLYA